MRDCQVLTALFLAVAAGCASAPHPGYCDPDTPCRDPEAAHCDLTHNQCLATPPGPPCDSASDCTGETAPLCIDDMCTGCIDDRECSQFAGRSHCRDDGACVQCLSSADCSALAPVCDAELFTCRPCLDHAECTSGVCQQDEGTCMAESAIVYVSPGGDDDDSCSLAAPCRTFSRAMTEVTDQRNLILAAPGDYVDNLSLAKPVTIWAHDAHLYGQQIDNPVVEVNGDAAVTIEGLAVRNAAGNPNLATGITCTGGALMSLSGLTIENNAGAGIDASDCTIDIADSAISQNQVGLELVEGMASLDQVTISNHRGPGVTLGLATTTTIRQSLIADNRGHGIYAIHAAKLDLRRTTIRRNRGGGVYGEDVELSALNNVISKNGRPAGILPTTSGPSGHGGLYLQEGDHLRPVKGRVEHNTIVDNYGDRDAGAAGIVCVEPASMDMRNNLVAHNVVDPPNLSPEVPPVTAQVAGPCSHSYTLAFPEAPSGSGNLEQAPQFVDRAMGDYHLVPASPGVNAGASSDLAVDVDGDSRPSGPAPDIGADEGSSR